MPFEIKKPHMPKKTFIINRNLHLDKDGKVVEEDDPAGKKNLGGRGKAFYEDEAKHYGLDESHRLVEPKLEEIIAGRAAEFAQLKDETLELTGTGLPPGIPVPEPEEHKGHLPEDFPGYAALAEAGINTYGQLRKLEDVTTIPGIGPATAEKIAEALAE